MTQERQSSLRILAVTGGFILWSSAFIALYGLQGYGCAAGLDRVPFAGINLLTALLLALWALHLLLVVLFVLWAYRLWRRHRPGAAGFLAGAMFAATLAALVATVYVGAPVLVLHPCA